MNSFTRLRYSGDTRALNGMLADLAKCPGVVLTIQFTNTFSEPGDWALGSHQLNFQLLVNLKSERIKMEELRLPELNGPPLKAARA